VGLQIFGSHFGEGKMLRAARQFEKSGGFAIGN
jgi:Asp-tRNA(Asn)/Glu-tRNA(Gln) amidotransferase A subunit family amidase